MVTWAQWDPIVNQDRTQHSPASCVLSHLPLIHSLHWLIDLTIALAWDRIGAHAHLEPTKYQVGFQTYDTASSLQPWCMSKPCILHLNHCLVSITMVLFNHWRWSVSRKSHLWFPLNEISGWGFHFFFLWVSLLNFVFNSLG